MASPAEMARRYGPETPVPDWHKRLVCSRCGSRDTDMVVSDGEEVTSRTIGRFLPKLTPVPQSAPPFHLSPVGERHYQEVLLVGV
jgi:hypothetical protein